MATIDDLSPGNKLSLKGKLFELQKKLSLLDLERKISEGECPFQPKMYSSEAHRHSKHAEELSKHKFSRKDSDSDIAEDPETHEFTYQPRVNHRRGGDATATLPVHERLYEKAKEYKAHIEKLSDEIRTKDSNGRLLFRPQINKSHPHHTPQGQQHDGDSQSLASDGVSGMGSEADGSTVASMNVQDYLYRDAMNREARLRAKREETEAQAAATASNVRVNAKSHELLRAKADRRVRSLFDLLDREARGVLRQTDVSVAFEGLVRRLRQGKGATKDKERGRERERDAHGGRGRENVSNHSNHSGAGDGAGGGSVELAAEALLHSCDCLWAKLDSDQSGEVTLARFQAVCTPAIMRLPQSAGGGNTGTGVGGSGAGAHHLAASGSSAVSAPATPGGSSSSKNSHDEAVAILCRNETELLEDRQQAERELAARKLKKTRRNSLLSASSRSPSPNKISGPGAGVGAGMGVVMGGSPGSPRSRSASPSRAGGSPSGRSPSPSRRMSVVQQQAALSALSAAATMSSVLKSANSSPAKARPGSPTTPASAAPTAPTGGPDSAASAAFQARLTKAAQKSVARRQQLLEETMKECTFQPKLHTAGSGVHAAGRGGRAAGDGSPSPKRAPPAPLFVSHAHFPTAATNAVRRQSVMQARHASPNTDDSRGGGKGGDLFQHLRESPEDAHAHAPASSGPTTRVPFRYSTSEAVHVELDSRASTHVPFAGHGHGHAAHTHHQHQQAAADPEPGISAAALRGRLQDSKGGPPPSASAAAAAASTPGAGKGNLLRSLFGVMEEENEDEESDEEEEGQEEGEDGQEGDEEEEDGEFEAPVVDSDAEDEDEEMAREAVEESDGGEGEVAVSGSTLDRYDRMPLAQAAAALVPQGDGEDVYAKEVWEMVVEAHSAQKAAEKDVEGSPPPPPPQSQGKGGSSGSGSAQDSPPAPPPPAPAPALPLHERLFKTRRQSMIIAEQPRPLSAREQQELAECTFRPAVPHTFAHSPEHTARGSPAGKSSATKGGTFASPASSAASRHQRYYQYSQQQAAESPLAQAKGYDEFLARVQKGKEKRREEQERWEALGKFDPGRYERTREQFLQEGFKTFEFETDRRLQRAANGTSHYYKYKRRGRGAGSSSRSPQRSSAEEGASDGATERSGGASPDGGAATADASASVGPSDSKDAEGDKEPGPGGGSFLERAFKRSASSTTATAALALAAAEAAGDTTAPSDTAAAAATAVNKPAKAMRRASTTGGPKRRASMDFTEEPEPDEPPPEQFVVNIKLSATKTVPFVVYDDAASAKELATSFARIHGLDGKAVEVLTGVLQQHIDARKEALKAQETPHA